MPEWTVGQDVWVVPNDRRRFDPHAARIAKIGRKWVTLDKPEWRPHRFDPTTGRIDGKNYSSPGTVYRDKATYEALFAQRRAVGRFREACERLRFDPLAHLTIAQLDMMTALLTGGPDATA